MQVVIFQFQKIGQKSRISEILPIKTCCDKIRSANTVFTICFNHWVFWLDFGCVHNQWQKTSYWSCWTTSFMLTSIPRKWQSSWCDVDTEYQDKFCDQAPFSINEVHQKLRKLQNQNWRDSGHLDQLKSGVAAVWKIKILMIRFKQFFCYHFEKLQN